jgi:Repeat of unknown function (DUF5648)
MFMIKKCFIFIVFTVLIVLPVSAAASDVEELLQPVLLITPREVNLGTIVPGGAGAESFTLKNMGSGVLEWSTSGPQGWMVQEGTKLSTAIEKKADYLRIEVRLLSAESQQNGNGSNVAVYFVEMMLENETEKIICAKRLPEGTHKEAIKIASTGGLRTIFVTFSIASSQQAALINLNPARLDMGSVSPGKTVSKKITLTNRGREMLRWSVETQKPKRNEPLADFIKGRYISFINDEVRNSGVYAVPPHLKDVMELAGRWVENEGYPSGAETDSLIRFRFQGTGIYLYLVTYSDESNLNIFLDERLVITRNRFKELKEKKDGLLVAEGLADGPHVLTISGKDSRLVFEGVRILGKSVMRAPAGSISIVPTSGTTTTQTNYLRVTFNAGKLSPGYYSDNIKFAANGGDGMVEVFAEVISDAAIKDIDIFRYSRGADYLFTANPQADAEKLKQKSYIKEGIAFRLFAPGTPGTTGFYRWYNPQKQSCFYHHDQTSGAKNLQGYIFEGALGNIATSRLTNSKELYRWYNPATGGYFFTTDSKAVNIRKKGYKFDGIAGYVK